MKRLIFFLLVAGVVFVTGAYVFNRQLADRLARELDAQRTVWAAEKSELEAALARARLAPGASLPPAMPTARVV